MPQAPGYKNRGLMIVNVASHSGYTSQYARLQQLYLNLRGLGLRHDRHSYAAGTPRARVGRALRIDDLAYAIAPAVSDEKIAAGIKAQSKRSIQCRSNGRPSVARESLGPIACRGCDAAGPFCPPGACGCCPGPQ
ncbi:MAG: hypothetical protein ACJ746_19635 [Bryobacteraceae bacterium]